MSQESHVSEYQECENRQFLVFVKERSSLFAFLSCFFSVLMLCFCRSESEKN